MRPSRDPHSPRSLLTHGRPRRHLAALALLAAATPQALAQCEVDLFSAASGGSGAFGRDLAASGQRVLVGAMLEDGPQLDTGAAYVFEYDGARFVEAARLEPPIQNGFETFGRSVALDGDLALVGANDDLTALHAGAGFVYEHGASGWQYSAALRAHDGELGDSLGSAVALEGERALLGAPLADDGQGAVYIFERSAGLWTQLTRLTPADPAGVHKFGSAVVLSGERIVVGSQGPSAALFVFDLLNGAWTETARLEGDFSIFSNTRRLDLERDRIAVCAGDLTGGDQRALVYELQNGTWTLSATLLPSHTSAWLSFGASLDLAGERVAVGSVDRSSFGSSPTFVEVFHRTASTWASEVIARPGGVGSATDNFGAAVALSQDALIVGSSSDTGSSLYSGAAYAFSLPVSDAASYCTALPNSTGVPATIESSCASRPFERLALRAQPVPNAAGLFAFSRGTAATPLGDGVRCVGGRVVRLSLAAAENGALSCEIDLLQQRASGRLLPGSTWHFQAWFRDAAAGGTGTNLSNGLRITFGD